MFVTGKSYSKKDIYEILNVPSVRRKGAWDTGYREYDGNLFIFSNVGIPGRTGHEYNNYWDGDLFVWEAKTNSNLKQPLIRKMLHPPLNQKIYLFTRTNDRLPFTFEGNVTVKESFDLIPVKIIWSIVDNPYKTYDEEASPDNTEDKLFYEGITKKVYVNKFERNPLARRMCIEHYGAHCSVCGFDFHKTYGELGTDFIHVHHIVPISEIRSEYLLDPIKDLIPICPNCHAMIHRGKRVLSPYELKRALEG